MNADKIGSFIKELRTQNKIKNGGIKPAVYSLL